MPPAKKPPTKPPSSSKSKAAGGAAEEEEEEPEAAAAESKPPVLDTLDHFCAWSMMRTFNNIAASFKPENKSVLPTGKA